MVEAHDFVGTRATHRRRPDPTIVGATVWVATLVAVLAGPLDLTIFQVFLLLGPLVVVPLGRPLVTTRSPVPHQAAVAAAAVAVLGALIVSPGAAAAALTIPWLVTVTVLTASEADRRWRGRAAAVPSSVLVPLLAVAAPAWLIVGAISLTASRAGATPFGITPELVELGAMHFSFAGFAAAALASCIVRWSGRPRLATVAAVATVGGAAVVALGHLTVRPLELLGATSMTVGVLLLGVLGWSIAPPLTVSRILLRIAALSVIVPMALALHYAWALTVGGVHLPYETIARIHGPLNAFGFSIGGLLAWRLLGSTRRSTAPRRADPAAADPPGSELVPAAAGRDE